jgi:membrane protein
MLLSRALSFKRADFDRRKAKVKLRQLLSQRNAKHRQLEADNQDNETSTSAASEQKKE